MSDVETDPRTATAARLRIKRDAASEVGDKRLLDELRAHEAVERFIQPTSSYAVVTQDRVLCLAGTFKLKFTSAVRPVQLKLGQHVPILGQEVEVIGHDGTSIKLHVKNKADLAALERASEAGAARSGFASAWNESGTDHATDEFIGLTWQEAEAQARRHMLKLGFHDARQTPSGADAGLDVLSDRAAAQVKHHASPVGRPDLQRLVGAAQGRPVKIFYSSSGYSTAATSYAADAGIALFRLSSEGVMTPVNRTARELEEGSDAIADDPVSDYLRGRRRKKEEELAPRIEFLRGCVRDLLGHCESLRGHPKRAIRNKASADCKACESMLLELRKAESPDRMMLERKASLRRVEKELKVLGASRGRIYW